MKTAKIVLLPLILASIIALFSMTGCATGGTTPTTGAPQGEFTQQQLKQILSDTTTNFQQINTYKFDMDMDMMVDVSGGSQPGKMTIISKISGATNIASQQTQMKMDMSMSVEGIGQQSGSQSLAYDMYMLPDWLYMKMDTPGVGEQWMKMPTTDELKQSFNMDVVEQQMGPLDSAVKIELLRYENVDGQECYVLAITPDMAEFMKWISEQQGTNQGVDWEDLATVSDVFKKLTYICYVTKDTNMLKKIIVDMEMEFTPEQAGASASDFNKMIMNMSLDMKLYDHNKPFSITLPDEAKNAVEVSEDMFQ